jgi:hypothetical protein
LVLLSESRTQGHPKCCRCSSPETITYWDALAMARAEASR